MKSMKKNFLISTLCCVFLTTSFTSLAENSYSIDNILYDINSVLPKNWNAKKVNDSTLTLERINLIPIGYKEVRKVSDSLSFKFILIFRNENIPRVKHIENFNKLMSSIDKYKKVNNITKLNFDNFYKKIIDKFAYFIPPTIIKKNYSVVIFDNVPNTFLELKEEGVYSEINDLLKEVISTISEPSDVVNYLQEIDTYSRLDYAQPYKLIFWGYLRDISYPNWKNF
jgi:hypothetical protein